MAELKYVDLQGVLHGGQSYVLGHSNNIRAVEHAVSTDTCYQKAALLGWDPERVVKALFFHTDSDRYGFVFSENGKRFSPKEVFPRVLGISRTKASRFRNHTCPEGMEFGTCTPFVLEESFDRDNLKGIFIHDNRSLEDSVVDISIGGIGDRAHKISLHLPYREIYKILYNQFGGRIKQATLFE